MAELFQLSRIAATTGRAMAHVRQPDTAPQNQESGLPSTPDDAPSAFAERAAARDYGPRGIAASRRASIARDWAPGDFGANMNRFHWRVLLQAARNRRPDFLVPPDRGFIGLDRRTAGFPDILRGPQGPSSRAEAGPLVAYPRR